jgi:hypothetical protein
MDMAQEKYGKPKMKFKQIIILICLFGFLLQNLLAEEDIKLSESPYLINLDNKIKIHYQGLQYIEDKKFTEAMICFKAAAKLGYSDSMHSLGVMYERGEGVSVDLIESYAWYSLMNDYIPSSLEIRSYHMGRLMISYKNAHQEIAKKLNEAELKSAIKRKYELQKSLSTFKPAMVNNWVLLLTQFIMIILIFISFRKKIN